MGMNGHMLVLLISAVLIMMRIVLVFCSFTGINVLMYSTGIQKREISVPWNWILNFKNQISSRVENGGTPTKQKPSWKKSIFKLLIKFDICVLLTVLTLSVKCSGSCDSVNL